MNYATNIALIDRKTSIVTNIIWGMTYQEEEFSSDEEFAVIIENLNVAIGDNYDGEHFYHEGERVLTINEVIADMEAALSVLLGGENA